MNYRLLYLKNIKIKFTHNRLPNELKFKYDENDFLRVTFPKLVQEVLQIDQEYFNLKKETIYNLIIEGLGFQEISSIGADIIDEKRSINFNLNEKNSKLFSEMLRKSGLNELSEAEFLKKIFITYAPLYPNIRERIVYKDIVLRTEEAIRKKRNKYLLQR